ncbi:DUF2080 family transposase-associated protein [Methanobrevibacter sp.]
MKVIIENAEESIVKVAKPHGNSARIIVPKKWIGRDVQLVLLSKDEDD